MKVILTQDVRGQGKKGQLIDAAEGYARNFLLPRKLAVLATADAINTMNLKEKARRAGTENLASIVGLGEAITVATASLEENMARITAMRDRLIDSLLQLPRTRLNGSREHRLPGNLNISFEGIEGESLLLRLDMAGICASSGSACTSGSLDPSHVLMAIGLKHEVAHGSLRLSLSELTTEEDIDYIIAQVPPIVEGLRAMSPVWEKIKDL